MKHGTFLGRKTAQTPHAIAWWEELLFSKDFSRIIEIGTYNGNFSYYLSLFCIERKAEFYTMDHVVCRNKNISKHFQLLDVFEHIEAIASLIQREGQTVIFCDGGNKPKEVEVFSVFLKKDDILVVHDWMTEILKKDIPHYLFPIPVEVREETTLKAFRKL